MRIQACQFVLGGSVAFFRQRLPLPEGQRVVLSIVGGRAFVKSRMGANGQHGEDEVQREVTKHGGFFRGKQGMPIVSMIRSPNTVTQKSGKMFGSPAIAGDPRLRRCFFRLRHRTCNPDNLTNAHKFPACACQPMVRDGVIGLYVK
jgi:hypothetical protein